MMFPQTHISYISKYRTEIMGYAILGVMLAHIKTICVFPDTFANKLLGALCYSVFTGGFMFLSGLGLYSSMYHNSNVKEFYKKRVIRLLIPYWIISIPYFIFTDLIIGDGFLTFLGHVTTVSFWLHGNYSGMWYVAAAAMFYLVYPLFHRVLYNGKTNPLFVLIGILVLWFVAIVTLKRYAMPFYEKTNVALNTFPLFLIGSLVMFWTISKKKSLSIVELAGILMGGAILLYTSGLWSIVNIVSIVILGIVFHQLGKNDRRNILSGVFHWLGTYSLELYILHLLIYYLLNAILGIKNEGWHIVIGVTCALLLCQSIHKTINLIIQKLCKS